MHFLEAGYAGTSLAAVAGTAGVSVDTIYKTFGSKIALLKGVLDVTIGGDDLEVPLLERAGPQALRQETDQRVQVAMLAAAVTDAGTPQAPRRHTPQRRRRSMVRRLTYARTIQVRQRRTAMRAIVGWIAARGPLRDGVTLTQAAHMVWTLTSPEVHLMMRDTGGWSKGAYREWLEDAIADGILGTTRSDS